MFTIPLSIHIFVMALQFGAKLQSQILKNLDPSEKELYAYVTSLAILRMQCHYVCD